MDNRGTVTYYSDGHLVKDALVLIADKAGWPKTTGLRRLSFFHLGSDQVRQLSETSTDEGRTWRTVYDFNYIRKKPAEGAGAGAAEASTGAR